MNPNPQNMGPMPNQQQQQQQPGMPMMRPQGPQQMPQNQGGGPMMQQMNNPMNQMQMAQNMNPQAQIKQNIVPNQQINPNQMNQGQVMGIMNAQGNQPSQMNPSMMNPNQMNNNPNMMMNPQGGGMMPVRPPPNQMVNPMAAMGQAQNIMQNQTMQQMRKQELLMPNQVPAGNLNFPVRSVTPNFMRQSPSPMSPIGLGQQHSIASPAMVPSPQAPMSNQPRGSVGIQNVMAPSPSAPMNTPGQPISSVQSPMNPVDDQIYREKYNRLTKYKEPLKKMISRVGSDVNSEKITKLKKLLEILSNPDTRIPLETLVKCEIVLENQFGALEPQGGASTINNPLYDAIANSLQNPLGNHILHRSFKSFDLIFGPDIKNLPPSKKRRLSEDQVVPSLPNEIPHILQREIARLNSKFKINLDQTSHSINSKNITLICCLDDKQLPPVPPLTIVIPEDYPTISPQCNVVEHEYDDSEFLGKVKKALKARVAKLPKMHSLTHILETWCLAVRQACNPNYVEPTTESVLLGI